MTAWKWPGVHDGRNYGERSRRSPEDDLGYVTWYIMKMEVGQAAITAKAHKLNTDKMQYFRQFFTDDFWENRVMRFGDGALSDFAAVGLRQKGEG
jgi:hypothetical protein